MTFKNLQFISKKRRGLSSIVGALLFVVLMVATFSVLGVALNSQTDIASTSRDVASKGLQKQQESFVLNFVQQGFNPSDYLEVHLTNKGQNIAEIFTVIMTNKTDPGEPTRTFEVPSETSFLPIGDTISTNIFRTLNLKMDIPVAPLKENYDFKVISSLGTVKTISVTCDGSTLICGVVAPPTPPGTSGLSAQLFLDGPTGVNGKVSTVIMFVQNTGSVPLEDVYPTREACLIGTFPTLVDGGTPIPGLGDFTCPTPTPAKDAGCGSTLTAPPGKNDGKGVCLNPGGLAIFKWDGTVAGDVGDVFTFANAATGEEYDDTPVGPTPLTFDTLEVINPNDCGGADCKIGSGGESIILIDDLLIRPSIFMSLPSPFGDNDGFDSGLWSLNLANPTDEPMSISKVTILAFPPGGESQDIVFQGKGVGGGTNNCLVEDIEPNTGTQPQGFWECPRDNILMWQSTTNPILLEANSTQSFVAKVHPYKIKTNFDNLDALIVQGNVYSTFGSFGKAGYQSSMYDANGSIVNVYLSDAADINLRDDYKHNINNMANFTDVVFNAVIADMDTVDTTVIQPGMRFIINVPREWTFNNFISCDGFDAIDGDGDCNDAPLPTAIVHSDGSTQIIAISTSDIGDGTNDARKISFSAKSPPVKAPRLFVMYMLADGETINTQNQTKTIGPVNEIVLNVDP